MTESWNSALRMGGAFIGKAGVSRLAGWLVLACLLVPARAGEGARFEGRYFAGHGDRDYLHLLDTARDMFEASARQPNLALLYVTNWNGLVEGPTWDAWWIQNSYGTTYAALPFLQEPFVTFLQNAQDLWFDQMGDGKRVGAAPPFDWVAPDGALCDAARPGWIVYKQGDGRTAIHDWGMEFTAAGMVLQSELLLIGRDIEAIAKYLPKLERCARFIESRRDPANDLFLAGPAGNLLAPSYAGWKKPDGTFGHAYLTGLSVTYIAALDRLIELETLAKRPGEAASWTERRDRAKRGLQRLATPEGYFIRSLDPDGTRHGVYGAERHGYFEASPNHDAIAFRVVDDAQAERIYQTMSSISGLRPHQFVLPNYPSYDDMYERPEGLWAYGTWVNGGHWSTCEARMILAYYRLGKHEDARRSMSQLMHFADGFRMDNPLTKCGSDVYQPALPINLTYDAFGPPAAFVRGLFEYRYSAEGLTLVPRLPDGLSRVDQFFPIRFGRKQVFVSAAGQGEIASVEVNGRRWERHDAATVFLPYESTPEVAKVQIALGGAKIESRAAESSFPPPLVALPTGHDCAVCREIGRSGARLAQFYRKACEAGLGDRYEAAHARLALACAWAAHERVELVKKGQVPRLPEVSEAAARKAYATSARLLQDGLVRVLEAPADGKSEIEQRLAALWRETAAAAR
ncbi:MAG TPA: hypothetical protein PKM43_03295 [Verrucomicrobiota bacterium]|nr:hypothetical protein [Verrucomicrobiota bacterium]HRZ37794.1 hypothetical protein [Candidatus Paceibacterota bacterium]HRZ58060.1 hypothetical protein [Candidatus Paceibacterota bacterium]